MDKNQHAETSPSSQRKQGNEIHTPLKSDNCNIQYGGISAKSESVVVVLTGKEKSRIATACSYMATLTIEPVMFGFMFAFVMNLSILPNMMMDKICLFYYNYSEEICKNMSEYKNEKTNVEAMATNYSLYASLTSLIAAFLMTFIAPWSDKYGRRLPLLVSVTGALLTDMGIILCSIYFESSVLYLVVSRLPSEFAGGFICMLTIVFSHASEVSSENNRTLKYTTVEIALGLGVAFGGLTGGFLYRYYGYTYVYSIVAGIHLFCFIWVLWVVQETTGLDVNTKWYEKVGDFFSFESFKAGVVVTCRRREGNGRTLLLLLIGSMCTIIVNYEAIGTIAYIYVHHIYDWDPTIYSVVNTTAWFAGILMTVTAVPLFIKVFKFRDFTLGIIGTFSMIGKNLFLAVSKNHTYFYYTGLALGIFTSLSSLAVRTGISKLVSREELGRVFSFLATCEAVIPMLGTIAVTQLFKATMDTFPNLTYSLGVTLLILPLGTFIWALKTTKTTYSELTVSINDENKEKV